MPEHVCRDMHRMQSGVHALSKKNVGLECLAILQLQMAGLPKLVCSVSPDVNSEHRTLPGVASVTRSPSHGHLRLITGPNNESWTRYLLSHSPDKGTSHPPCRHRCAALCKDAQRRHQNALDLGSQGFEVKRLLRPVTFCVCTLSCSTSQVGLR